jgi:hypothetical protein
MAKEIDKQSKEYKVAYEIASGLNDLDSLDFHVSVALQLNEKVIRELFQKVMRIPDHKISSSRAAYYNHLVQRHGWRGYRD